MACLASCVKAVPLPDFFNPPARADICFIRLYDSPSRQSYARLITFSTYSLPLHTHPQNDRPKSLDYRWDCSRL